MILQTGKRRGKNRWFSRPGLCRDRVLKKGFLLLEVLVSVAILSFGLVLIMNSFTRSLRALELSDNYFKASILLSKKIFEIENQTDGLNLDLEKVQREGRFEDFGKRFSWSLEDKKDEDEEEKIIKIKLRVYWEQNRKEEDLSIVTYFPYEESS